MFVRKYLLNKIGLLTTKTAVIAKLAHSVVVAVVDRMGFFFGGGTTKLFLPTYEKKRLYNSIWII